MNNMNKCRIPFQNAETKILLKKTTWKTPFTRRLQQTD